MILPCLFKCKVENAYIKLYSDNHLINKQLHAKSVIGSFRTTKIYVFLESVYVRATNTRAEYIEI